MRDVKIELAKSEEDFRQQKRAENLALLATDPYKEAPWQVLPEEDSICFEDFNIYKMLGRNRTVRQVIVERNKRNNRGAINGDAASIDYWVSYVFCWNERALAWDVHLQKIDDEQFIHDRQQARDMRRSILGKFGALLGENLGQLEYSELSWRNASEAVKILTDSLRQEFNDLPSQKVETSITYRLVQELTIVYTQAFEFANQLPTVEARSDAFRQKLLEIGEQVGAA